MILFNDNTPARTTANDRPHCTSVIESFVVLEVVILSLEREGGVVSAGVRDAAGGLGNYKIFFVVNLPFSSRLLSSTSDKRRGLTSGVLIRPSELRPSLRRS